MLEIELETRAVNYLEERGHMALKLRPMGNPRGFPDRAVFSGGRVWFIEFKRPDKGVVSVHQTYWHQILGNQGFNVHVIENWKEFEDVCAKEI